MHFKCCVAVNWRVLKNLMERFFFLNYVCTVSQRVSILKSQLTLTFRFTSHKNYFKCLCYYYCWGLKRIFPLLFFRCEIMKWLRNYNTQERICSAETRTMWIISLRFVHTWMNFKFLFTYVERWLWKFAIINISTSTNSFVIFSTVREKK